MRAVKKHEAIYIVFVHLLFSREMKVPQGRTRTNKIYGECTEAKVKASRKHSINGLGLIINGGIKRPERETSTPLIRGNSHGLDTAYRNINQTEDY